MKKYCLEYVENIKIMERTAISVFQQTENFDEDPKEGEIDAICKQVHEFHLRMIKQPKKAPKHAQAGRYKCGNKVYYTS